METMKTTVVAAVSMAAATATIGFAAPVHADESYYEFLSPSANIACSVGTGSDGKSGAGCDIRDHTSTPPPRPLDCHQGWGDRVSLEGGSAPVLHCHGDTEVFPGKPTLPYGQTRSAGPITCDSEPTGVTCTDTSTGHFFRLSRDSYQLG
jgi:hypothetical protein